MRQFNGLHFILHLYNVEVESALLFGALYFIAFHALNCVPLYCSVFLKYHFIHSLHFQSWHFILMLLAILDSYGSHCSIAPFLAGLAASNCISFHFIALVQLAILDSGGIISVVHLFHLISFDFI